MSGVYGEDSMAVEVMVDGFSVWTELDWSRSCECPMTLWHVGFRESKLTFNLRFLYDQLDVF